MRSAKDRAWDVVGRAVGMLYLTSDERDSIAVEIEREIIADREARAPLAGRVSQGECPFDDESGPSSGMTGGKAPSPFGDTTSGGTAWKP